MSKLYIIGNGFDRYHGIPSGYQDFGDYLERVDNKTFSTMQECFVITENFWWKFEENLATFDASSAIAEVEHLIVGYGSDDWSDADHHAFPEAVDELVSTISVTVMRHFGDWIRALPSPEPELVGRLRLQIDASAQFLNFNYTPTLQRTYNVPDTNVWHIHGAAASSPSTKLVLGHAWRAPARRQEDLEYEADTLDPRVLQANDIIAQYFKTTFKPTNEIIRLNQSHFDKYKCVGEVIVLGHSLADVDLPYIQEIMSRLDLSAVDWTLSYHGDADIRHKRAIDIGIPESRIRLAQLSDFATSTKGQESLF